eukprot:scaffold7876_cov417-Prasinococcus_capsulatus_cf.AAC.6
MQPVLYAAAADEPRVPFAGRAVCPTSRTRGCARTQIPDVDCLPGPGSAGGHREVHLPGARPQGSCAGAACHKGEPAGGGVDPCHIPAGAYPPLLDRRPCGVDPLSRPRAGIYRDRCGGTAADDIV